MGTGPGDTLPVRLDPELRNAVDDRAAAEHTTASNDVRKAQRSRWVIIVATGGIVALAQGAWGIDPLERAGEHRTR